MIVRAVRVRSFSLFLVQLDWCKLWIYIFLRMQLCSELLRVNEQTADPRHSFERVAIFDRSTPCLRLIILVRSSSPLMEQGTYNRRFRKCRRGALVCCKRSNMLLYRTYGQGLAGQADSRPN